ncbi:OmpP1/FadL family transporter [Campylobacter curvus]|uniref:OmpP1/FadL family transporter n=1 Tax=Campylobacter curvus TaxID=200 RepID=UPI00147061E4|nr:outer membrane protein transport protein [Campylobacter curvus]
MTRTIALSMLAACSLLNAGGYKVPEQSADSLGLLASNVAMSFGADAAYFNPANMMFLDGKHHFEGSLGWFHIGELKFKNDNGKSYKSENFDSLATTFSFVSPEYYENWRFGLALAVPAAVGMAWEDADTAFTGKRFKLQVVELNPTVAYRINDSLAVAVGARAVYSKGKVASDFGRIGYRELEGDSIDYGYNAALSFRPIENLSLAATYRSKVDMTIKGDATGTFNGALRAINYSGAAKVQIPLPAQLVLAAGYKISDFTLLLAYERTYWSKFKGYDFEYSNKNAAQTNPPLAGYFNRLMDDPVNRKYSDSNTYRLGVAYDASERLRLMAGFAYDQDVSNAGNTGLELPNTTSRAYSFGVNYKISEALEVALGYVYQDRHQKRAENIPNGQNSTISGEFGRGAIQILATSFKYNF